MLFSRSREQRVWEFSSQRYMQRAFRGSRVNSASNAVVYTITVSAQTLKQLTPGFHFLTRWLTLVIAREYHGS